MGTNCINDYYSGRLCVYCENRTQSWFRCLSVQFQLLHVTPTRLNQSSAKIDILTDTDLEQIIPTCLIYPRPRSKRVMERLNFRFPRHPQWFSLIQTVKCGRFPLLSKISTLLIFLPVIVGQNANSDAWYLDFNTSARYLNGLSRFGELSFRHNLLRQVKTLDPRATVPATISVWTDDATGGEQRMCAVYLILILIELVMYKDLVGYRIKDIAVMKPTNCCNVFTILLVICSVEKLRS